VEEKEPSERMSTRGAGRRWYLMTAVFMAAVTSGCAVWRYQNGELLSEETLWIYNFVMALLLISWLVSDPKIPGVHRPSFDHGALLWASFPFLAIFQMFAAHRWRGIFIVLGLMVLWVAPDLVIALIYGAG
jgi:hypothetical protein